MCLQIQHSIEQYQKTVMANKSEGIDKPTKVEQGSVDSAWTQINRYQNMTLREREEALTTDTNMDVKPKTESIPFAHQLPIGVTAPRGRGRGGAHGKPGRGKPGSTAINPNFRGIHGGTDRYPELEQAVAQYPDVRVAIPYLKVSHPDASVVEMNRKRRDEQLGDPSSLLWTYWKTEEKRQLGSLTSQSDGKIWITDRKTQVRKRMRKEFDGRLVEVHKPGAGPVESADLVNMLPL
jgi:hypothetical protein